MSLPRLFSVGTNADYCLEEVKGTLALFSFFPHLPFLIRGLSFKILPVSWCGTAKIKTCSTNWLNKLTWFIIDWLCVKPLSLYLCPGDWTWPPFVEKKHFGRRAAAADHFFWALLPKCHEESQVNSLGATYSPHSGGLLWAVRLSLDQLAFEAEMLVLEALI